MNKIKALFFIVPVIFTMILSGCGLLLGGNPAGKFVGTAMDKAAGVAGDKVGQKVGENVGNTMAGYAETSLRGLSPALMQMYVSSLFSSVFYAGGYSFDYYNQYKPGEWTKWKATGMETGSEFQKAFLKKLDDGKEWWQVSAINNKDGQKEEVVLEALFSAPDQSGLRTLLRLRSLFPGDTEPAEVPVQENSGAWYHEPIKITKESLEAATTGTETVTTPAGAFTAKHVVYRDVYGVGEWWLSEKAPGGFVKYQVTNKQAEGEKENKYTVELVGFGTSASSRLKSF